MYWLSQNDVRNDLVASSIHRERFILIIRHLHFAHTPSEGDLGWKIQPVLTHMNRVFEKYVQMSENFSVDESMIEYFGPHQFKQYIKGKPIRYGFEVWMLCSSTGPCHRFSLYSGRTVRSERVSLGETVVQEMMSIVPSG